MPFREVEGGKMPEEASHCLWEVHRKSRKEGREAAGQGDPGWRELLRAAACTVLYHTIPHHTEASKAGARERVQALGGSALTVAD